MMIYVENNLHISIIYIKLAEWFIKIIKTKIMKIVKEGDTYIVTFRFLFWTWDRKYKDTGNTYYYGRDSVFIRNNGSKVDITDRMCAKLNNFKRKNNNW